MLHTCAIRKAGASCVSAAALRTVRVSVTSDASSCFWVCHDPFAAICTPRYLKDCCGAR